MVNFHDISYNGIWFRERFNGNVVVLETIPKGMRSDGSRKLTVPIVIKENVLETIDELNAIFREKEKKLIFKIQKDRYYIATMVKELDPTSAVRHSGLVLEFEAEDGYAYSVNPKRIEARGVSELTITNQGTASAYPTISVTNKSDNGWISIINETGVFAAGEEESVDMDEKPSRVMLVPGLSSFSSGRTTTIPSGDLAQGTLTVSGSQVTLGAKGAWGDGKKWCGGYNVVSLPATGAGAGTGDKRFYAHFKVAAETGKVSQTGLLKVLFLDRNNEIIAMYDVHKGNTAKNTADFIMWYGGNSLRKHRSFTFVPSNKEGENPLRSGTHGSIDFEKIGAKLSFFWWGKRHDVHVPELADVAIAKVGIFIGQYGTRDMSANHFFTHLKFKSFFVELKNLDKDRGVKNLFLLNDVLTVDMATTDISINGRPRADVFARGGDFLSIPPGESKMLFGRSEWAQDVDVVVEMRERWH